MTDDLAPIAFEAALAELEEIVEALERGGADLGGALAGYGRGVALLGHCQAILDGAERSVALLTGVDDAGRPVTAPFDAAATAGAIPTAAPTPIPTPTPAPIAAPPEPPSPLRRPAGEIPEAPF